MTSRFQPPPIIKTAERLAIEIEKAVRRFARYHRYQIGSDLRMRAQQAFITANTAWRERDDQLRFDHHWADGLLQLQRELRAGRWQPRPSTCFIATKPKAREIHAPDFADRVVHHWLVPQLEVLWEPTFIHDSYANRKGRGSHAAVRRAQQFVRQVHSGQGGGWYLQLDVAEWEGQHVRGDQLRGTPADFRDVSTRVASFAGHLQHANTDRLMRRIYTRFPWLHSAVRPRRFSHRAERRVLSITWLSKKENHA